MIVDERITAYLHSLETPNPEILQEMEFYAKEHRIPVIRKEAESLLKVLLFMTKPDRVLEVGTAIGYSAILMAGCLKQGATLTTIENYGERILKAQDNIARSGYGDRIILRQGDAMEVLPTLEGSYDFIFMDAAKGQYMNFFPEIFRLLAPEGVLVSDNVLQEGDVVESRFAVTRRNRTIHARMREYLYLLKHHPDLETTILPLGDGLSVSVKKPAAADTREDEKNEGAIQPENGRRPELLIQPENRRRPELSIQPENGRRPELLIPAGSLEVLQTAVRYGADAVYIGGDAYGLRAKAKNFSLEEMKEGVSYAHREGVRVYVTVNIFAHNGDLEGIRAYLEELREVKPDALIISDPAVFMLAREILPETELHVSTQSNNTNYGTFQFWHQLGAKRAVAARELSLEEIREIRKNIPKEMEIEAFVHGAMCISYSGRCLLSSFLTGRDANRGACTHPCRWKYFLVEEQRPGEYMPVLENDRGTFLFNSRDLCMIDHIPELISAGIDSFKVEGRMKTALYIAAVTRAYRKAIDDFFQDPELYRNNLPRYQEDIASCNGRKCSTGFFFGKPDESAQIYDGSTYDRNYTYLGICGEPSKEHPGRYFLEQKNKFSVGEQVQIMGFDGTDRETRVTAIYDETGNCQESAPHARQKLWVEYECPVHPGEVIRRRDK